MTEVLFLTNNDNALELYNWIAAQVPATLFQDKLSIDSLKKINPKFVVSYNYKYIIPADCIEFMNHRIINMHISYLPWNKGSSPNIWSFIDDTPKGVTIHEMSAGLDGGNIIYQRKVTFDLENDTLASSYNKLNQEIANLFKEHFEDLLTGNYSSVPQDGHGSYHTMKNLHDFEAVVDFEWNDLLCDFIQKVADAKKESLL